MPLLLVTVVAVVVMLFVTRLGWCVWMALRRLQDGKLRLRDASALTVNPRKRIRAFEDQLPVEWMPEAFFRYWTSDAAP